jgi:hypothetical protein
MRVAVTVLIVLGRLDQPVHLVDGQVLPRPNGPILWPAWRNCSILVGVSFLRTVN